MILFMIQKINSTLHKENGKLFIDQYFYKKTDFQLTPEFLNQHSIFTEKFHHHPNI